MNSTAKIAAVAAAAVLVAGLLFVVLGGTNTGPDVEDAKREPVKTVTVMAPAAKKDRGPDGRTIEKTGRETRKAGLPERPPEGGPLDEQTWQEERQKADEKWTSEMNEGVEVWLGERSEIKGRRSTELLNAVDSFTRNVARTRAEIQSGRRTPAEGREEMRELRTRMNDNANEILGGDDAEALNTYLREKTMGGGW